jgi:hypothetical protein
MVDNQNFEHQLHHETYLNDNKSLRDYEGGAEC